MPLSLSIAEEFTRTPGSRYEREGDFSGEVFRRELLLPRVTDAIGNHSELLVDLDGTAGYGTSFLEEAFGGLVRDNEIRGEMLHRTLRFRSKEEGYLVDDIWTYIDEAEAART